MNLAALKQYLPILGMVLAAVLQVLYIALQDNALSLVEGLNLAVALLGAVTTYVVPRLPGITWLKPLVAALTAALMVVVDAVAGSGVSAQTWVMAAIQFVVGLGIVVATQSNVPVMTPPRHAAPLTGGDHPRLF